MNSCGSIQMAQLGHTDPKMTLGIYAKVIASNGQALDDLIGVGETAPIGTSDPITAETGESWGASGNTKAPLRARLSAASG
jgi:hypothetical protein